MKPLTPEQILILKEEFDCGKCGNCCKVSGYVYLTCKEAKEISRFLKIPLKEFRRKYTRKLKNKLVIKQPYKGRCLFFKKRLCVIYNIRPEQCRTFPFWKENLNNTKDWKNTLTYCKAAKSL